MVILEASSFKKENTASKTHREEALGCINDITYAICFTFKVGNNTLF